jgi:hypothetical protein
LRKRVIFGEDLEQIFGKRKAELVKAETASQTASGTEAKETGSFQMTASGSDSAEDEVKEKGKSKKTDPVKARRKKIKPPSPGRPWKRNGQRCFESSRI